MKHKTNYCMKHTFLLTILLALYCFPAVGQTLIEGTVTDEEGAPLEFANVMLLALPDSTLLQGTVTDAQGHFSLPWNREESLLKCSFVGYVDLYVPVKGAEAGTLVMKENAQLMDEVVVKGKRQLFKMENGGITMDVANSPLKDVGTAMDVLEKQPFLTKKDGTLTVFGKGAPVYYINHRKVRDLGQLERLSSNDIKSITVITSPGAEYGAEVNAVVLIEAKRKAGEGWSIEANGTVTAARKVSDGGNVGMNYRANGLDVFARYGYSEQRSLGYKTATREQGEPDRLVYIDNEMSQDMTVRGHYAEGGLNYEFGKNHSAGAQYTYSRTPGHQMDCDMSTDIRTKGETPQAFQTTMGWEGENTSHLVNAYYQGRPTKWLWAQADVDYAKGSNSNSQSSWTDGADEMVVATGSRQTYEVYAGRLTFSTPVWGSNLSYGAEYSHTSNKQHFQVDEDEGTALPLETNGNLAKQDAWAAFVQYSKGFGRWSVSAGLRYERLNFGYWVNNVKQQEQSRIYSDLFPSASVSYRGELVQMMLSYRSTTRRPSYYNLRNTMQYDDPYTYETGNPYLRPRRTDDFTYMLIWRDIRFSASYRRFHHLFINLPTLGPDNVAIFRPEDLKEAQDLAIMAYYSPTIGWWEPTVGLGVWKDFLKYKGRKYEKPYLDYSFQNIFRLPLDFTLMVDLYGNTKGYLWMNYRHGKVWMNVRLTKRFLDGKLILNLTGSDVLNTYRSKKEWNLANFRMLMDDRGDVRSLTFSVRYRFNAVKSKYKGKSASATERQRM